MTPAEEAMHDVRRTQDGSVIEVVALVASTGGLDALTAVLRGLPADLTAAVVAQQHHGSGSSALAQILSRRTGLDIIWATDGARLVPGQVIICPPLKRLEVLPDGTCAVLDSVGARERPHDDLLSSLADSFGSRSLAVVLTGMLDDGAAGTAAMKAAGGIVFAQSEDTAEQPSMPQAAAEAGADLVLPLHEIARVVTDVVRGVPVPRPNAEIEAIGATFGEVGQIAGRVHDVDWSRHPLGPVRGWSPSVRTVLRLAMDSPLPTLVSCGDQHYVFPNEAAVSLMGERCVELLGRAYRNAFPEFWAEVSPLHATALSGKHLQTQTLRFPFRIGGRTGGQLAESWFEVSHTPIHGVDGSVAGVHQAFLDRTREVLAARRLRILDRLAAAPVARNPEQQLALALGVLDDSDVPFALAYLVDATRSRGHLVGSMGVAAGTAIAPRAVRLAPGSPWPLGRVVEQGSPVLLKDLGSRFRGHLIGPRRLSPQSAVLHPLRDEVEDKVGAVLVLGTNPSLPLDDRYLEFLRIVGETIRAALARSQASQHERRRRERESELDRLKTEFFTNLSHEFGTPLTLMLAPLEELRLHPDRPRDERSADVDVVTRNAHRLFRLVRTLLDLSQAEAGQLRARLARTDLADLTAEIAAAFCGAAETLGLKLSIHTPPLSDVTWIDPEMWEKIVSNLVSNALKFTWQGTVDVALRDLPDHVELMVRDTGVGIPAEEIPYVFQRFHRVREARGRTQEGTGIGLALVHELVQAHRGRVRVVSKEGEGTAFTVWIPRNLARPSQIRTEPAAVGGVAAAMADEAGRWDAPRESRRSALGLDAADGVGQPLQSRVPGARILVVDDNADMREFLVRLIGGSWPATEARDGAEALELLCRERFDLVVAHAMMPGADGCALLRRIRSDERLARLPVVLVTARAGEETAIDGLLAGADDYVVKPFSARELVARIGAQLELSRVRRAGEERLRRVLETETVGVLYFDHAGTVIDANDVFLRMTGYSRAEVARGELTWRLMTPPEWTPVSERQLQRLAATGRIGPYEKEYILADGSRRWMLFVGREIGDGTICEFCIDITDLKNAETA